MSRVRFPFLSKSFTEREIRAGGLEEEEDEEEEWDKVEKEEKQAEEHLRGQTTLCRLQQGELVCHPGL